MKKVHFLFSFLILLLFSVEIQSQIFIDTITSNYCQYVEEIHNTEYYKIVEYEILNSSDDDYLTWVSSCSIKNKSESEIVREFFVSNKGDFNYFSLISDNLLNSVVPKDIIGFTFIKRISKGEKFSYHIIKSNSSCAFYSDRIVIIKRERVEEYIKMKLEEQFFSELPSVFLMNDPLILKGGD